MKKKAVVLGGGISGLISAYLLANSNQYEVHVVEKNDKLGGLLRSFEYENFGHFDYGAHNILETGIQELDDFYYSLFEDDEWQVSMTVDGQMRALTGLMYDKVLQQNSPFMDIRENEKIEEYIGSFFLNLTQTNHKFKDLYKHSAYEYSLYLFGSKITDDIIVPALVKIYKEDPKKLNSIVLFLTQFTRIGLLDESIMLELLKTEKICSRLSYPEQLNLPLEQLTSLKSLYPKNFGIYRVIEAMKKKLLKMGVKFHLNSSVSKVKLEKNQIASVWINDKEYATDIFVCSVGQSTLAKLLGVNIEVYTYDKNPKTVITNILIDKKLTCGELSFIYSYDKDSVIFRIDNYINYCDGAKRNGLYPVSIESLHFRSFDIKEIEKKIIEEMIEYNILDRNTKVEFIKTEILEYGFPLLTQNNINNINNIRNNIQSLNIYNLVNIGVLSEEGLFFENHIVHDTYNKIKEKL